jgi:hypothetical protein
MICKTKVKALIFNGGSSSEYLPRRSEKIAVLRAQWRKTKLKIMLTTCVQSEIMENCILQLYYVN